MRALSTLSSPPPVSNTTKKKKKKMKMNAKGKQEEGLIEKYERGLRSIFLLLLLQARTHGCPQRPDDAVISVFIGYAYHITRYKLLSRSTTAHCVMRFSTTG
jgi:hypothetical protein